MSGTCGKVVGVMGPYEKAFEALLGRIRVRADGEQVLLSVSNLLLPSSSGEGSDQLAFLVFDDLFEKGALENPVLEKGTSTVFRASESFAKQFKKLMATQEGQAVEEEIDQSDLQLGWRSLKNSKLAHLLTSNMFTFKKPAELLLGEENRLERSLLPHLPKVLTSPYDNELSASLICMQSEFDRSVHSVAAEPTYKGKNLILISGLNIDVSPAQDLEEAFPATMFLPWAAYVQLADGKRHVVEQQELVSELFSRSTDNPDELDIENSINELFERKRRRITFYDSYTNKKKAAQVL